MKALLSSCLKQVEIIHRNIVRVRYSISIILFEVINIICRFEDRKISAGRLKFFVNLCKKLKTDIDRFAAILSEARPEASRDQEQQVSRSEGCRFLENQETQNMGIPNFVDYHCCDRA